MKSMETDSSSNITKTVQWMATTTPDASESRSAANCLQCSSHPTLHGRHDARPQLGCRDDGVHRTHLASPLDVVDLLELRGHLTELLRAHRGPQVGELDPQLRSLRVVLASASCASTRRTGSAAVRVFTSRVNTTAAAGAPPITEANEPSTAITSMLSFSAPENTTNAPPW